MLYGIFVESTDKLGILYDRYKNIPETTKKFMDIVNNAIDRSISKGVPDIDISGKLTEFKKDVKMQMIDPKAISSTTLKKTKNEIKSLKENVFEMLRQLGSMRKKFKYNDNAIKGILIKPKIYINTIDDNDHIKVNSFVRSVSNSLDWIEKVILDMMNLCDQDLNLLSLAGEVYFRKIFENMGMLMTDTDEFGCDDLVECPVYEDEDLKFGERFNKLYVEGSLSSLSDDMSNNSEVDLLGYNIGDEEYYPIFPIGISYDFDDPEASKFGKRIETLTNGDAYTHSLLAFDTDLEHIIQFQMKGIERGNIKTYDAVRHTKSIYVACVFVTKDELRRIKSTVDEYERNPTKYDVLNFVSMALGKPSRADKRHICSTFVGYLLNIADPKNLTKDYSKMRPGDVTILPRAFFVGTYRNYDDFENHKDEFKRKVKQIYDDNIDDIREYNNEIPKIMLDNNLKKSGSIRDFFANLLFGR